MAATERMIPRYSSAKIVIVSRLGSYFGSRFTKTHEREPGEICHRVKQQCERFRRASSPIQQFIPDETGSLYLNERRVKRSHYGRNERNRSEN